MKKQNVDMYENDRPQETKCCQKEWSKLPSAWFAPLFKWQKSIIEVKCRTLLVDELVLNRDSKYCKNMEKLIPEVERKCIWPVVFCITKESFRNMSSKGTQFPLERSNMKR